MRKVSFPWLKNVCIKCRKPMKSRRFETKIWVNNKVSPKCIINKMDWNQFPVMGGFEDNNFTV